LAKIYFFWRKNFFIGEKLIFLAKTSNFLAKYEIYQRTGNYARFLPIPLCCFTFFKKGTSTYHWNNQPSENYARFPPVAGCYFTYHI